MPHRKAEPARELPRPGVQRVLALQRAAGNAAVSRLLMRDIDDMIAAAREREDAARTEELRDPAEWDIDPDEPMPDAGRGPEPDAHGEEAVPLALPDTGLPAGAVTQPSIDLPAHGGGIVHSGLRASPRANRRTRCSRRPTRTPPACSGRLGRRPGDVAGRRPMPHRFHKELEKTVGQHAANVPAANALNPQALAALPATLAQQSHAAKQQRVAGANQRHQSNVQERTARHQEAQAGKLQHAADVKPTDKMAESLKKVKSDTDSGHEAMVAANELEYRFTALRDRARALRRRLTPGLRVVVEKAIADNVDKYATKPAPADSSTVSSELDAAEQAIQRRSCARRPTRPCVRRPRH